MKIENAIPKTPGVDTPCGGPIGLCRAFNLVSMVFISKELFIEVTRVLSFGQYAVSLFFLVIISVCSKIATILIDPSL